MSHFDFPVVSGTALAAIQRLVEVVAQLRSPVGGCPWDLAQTPQTLAPYILEEAYETVAALQDDNPIALAEELGDLLLQVVLQAQIASEADQFSLREIADGIADKLVRRHPHVFADQPVNTIDEVHQNWQQIKATEKGEDPNNPQLGSKLDRYARTLPPLTAALKISQRAAQVGFEWDDISGVWAKFQEELTEFREALATSDQAHQQAELGDLLFTLVNLARWYNLDPIAALQGTNRRFVQRFSQLESQLDRPLADYSLEELEELWQRAKAQLKHSQHPV